MDDVKAKRLTKKEREELLKLKEILDNSPNAKKVLEALVDNQNPELYDVVHKTITPHLEKARMMGVQIGWNGALITLEGQCRQCETKEEILELLRNKKKETLEKLNLKDFDDDNDDDKNEVNE